MSLLQEFKCAYVVIVMAILWLTEALPIPVTALLPIFLFPMLGVLTGKTVCSKYVNVSIVYSIYISGVERVCILSLTSQPKVISLDRNAQRRKQYIVSNYINVSRGIEYIYYIYQRLDVFVFC